MTVPPAAAPTPPAPTSKAGVAIEREDIISAMTNYLRIEQDKHFIDRFYIVGKDKAADRILTLLTGRT